MSGGRGLREVEMVQRHSVCQCQHSQGLVATGTGLGSEEPSVEPRLAQSAPRGTSAPRSLPGPHSPGLPWEIKAALTCLK